MSSEPKIIDSSSNLSQNNSSAKEEQSLSVQPSSYTELLQQDFQQLFDSLDIDNRQKHFLRSRWLEQLIWMEQKATNSRNNYYLFRKTAIILGIIVPILIGIQTDNARANFILKAAAIGFSGTAAICAAIEEFHHYGERWFHYRRTAESLKSQGWRFSQLSGQYSRYNSHKEAFRVFADYVEEIIERDVENFVIQMTKQEEQETKKQEDKS